MSGRSLHLGRLQIDDELELGRLSYGQVAWLRSRENTTDIRPRLTLGIFAVIAVAHQAPLRDHIQRTHNSEVWPRTRFAICNLKLSGLKPSTPASDIPIAHKKCPSSIKLNLVRLYAHEVAYEARKPAQDEHPFHCFSRDRIKPP